MFHPQGPTFWELVMQALSSTECGYDQLAPKFDHTPFRTPDAILAPIMTHIGNPGSIATALDVCCGTGAAMWHLRRLCRHRVIGIDFSQGMLDIARHVVATAPGDARFELVRGNVLDMPFDTAFDVAVCVGALGHILPTNQARFVRQVAKVLRPGGRFVFVTAPVPPLWSIRYWLLRSFNAVMQVRNFCLSPPFVMYYLTFLLPQAVALLRQYGFSVDVYHDVFDGRFCHLQLVIGTLHETQGV